MKIDIQFEKMSSNSYVEKLATKKLKDLGDKYDWILNANVFFKKDNDTKGKGKICKIRLRVPGYDLFASSDQESFEIALAETLKDLERQIRKRKTQMSTH
ncbi:putative sigma-54 modulation protein [Zhouia amylolytica]|uniref:Putative sigma-54 modulation protein n=1 Tax=Zhouia amylolytica TaxID=376730 RepID=A0A1I6RMC5_9FLAO|nr:HPF/RaiA family ribosome-associated protein [Zhouia amylolytica]MCQ0110523.1 HPF/RaiA family ribosome-associated protein [Zhouia amylolytica]SFS65859.1 putative sigma-54 modulation protein [Zhouia amylolytica]